MRFYKRPRWQLLVTAIGTFAIGDLSSSVVAQVPPKPVDQNIWVFPEDYPAEAAAQAQEGPTSVIVSIAASGAVTDCRVGITSGSSVLDRTACQVIARRGAFVPARDAGGSVVPSTYIAKIWWGIWRKDYRTDAGNPAYQTISLEIDGEGKPVECGTSKDNVGIRLSLEACHELVELLPRAVALSPIKASMTLSATKLTKPVAKDNEQDDLSPGETVLREVKTIYDVRADGRIGSCRTIASGALVDPMLIPPDLCAARTSAVPTSRREMAIWRISTMPVTKIPLRRYVTDVSAISEPGDATPACHGTVGPEESSLEQICEYARVSVERVRTRIEYTGRLEVHYRAGSRYGATKPSPTAVPDGETLTHQWVRHYRVGETGAVTDCIDTYTGLFASEPGSRACDILPPAADRTVTGDPGGSLWVEEDLHYTYRKLPDLPSH